MATLSRNGSGGFNVNDRRAYDAWGVIRQGNTTGDPKGRYCANLGHVQDDESGLIYMRARYYEPTNGRFVGQDIARQSWNWFSYCNNDPIQLSDATGNYFHLILGALCGGISAAIHGSVSGYSGWKLVFTIAVGVIAGVVSALTGAWISGLINGAGGIFAGGSVGGMIGSAINTLYDELSSGHSVNWGRVLRSIGVGGIAGLCCGAIGAAAQRNGEIAAAIAGLDGDVIQTANDTVIIYNEQNSIRR